MLLCLLHQMLAKPAMQQLHCSAKVVNQLRSEYGESSNSLMRCPMGGTILGYDACHAPMSSKATLQLSLGYLPCDAFAFILNVHLQLALLCIAFAQALPSAVFALSFVKLRQAKAKIRCSCLGAQAF